MAKDGWNMATLKQQLEIEMNYTFTVNIPSYFVDNIKSTFSRLTGKEMTDLIRDMGVFLEDDVLEEWLYEDFIDLIEE